MKLGKLKGVRVAEAPAKVGPVHVRRTPKLATLAPQPEFKTVGVRDCDQCEGRYDKGMWVHSDGCSKTVMLWFAHHPNVDTEMLLTMLHGCCPFKCPGEALPSGVTHHWACGFWHTTEATPF